MVVDCIIIILKLQKKERVLLPPPMDQVQEIGKRLRHLLRNELLQRRIYCPGIELDSFTNKSVKPGSYILSHIDPTKITDGAPISEYDFRLIGVTSDDERKEFYITITIHVTGVVWTQRGNAKMAFPITTTPVDQQSSNWRGLANQIAARLLGTDLENTHPFEFSPFAQMMPSDMETKSIISSAAASATRFSRLGVAIVTNAQAEEVHTPEGAIMFMALPWVAYSAVSQLNDVKLMWTPKGNTHRRVAYARLIQDKSGGNPIWIPWFRTHGHASDVWELDYWAAPALPLIRFRRTEPSRSINDFRKYLSYRSVVFDDEGEEDMGFARRGFFDTQIDSPMITQTMWRNWRTKIETEESADELWRLIKQMPEEKLLAPLLALLNPKDSSADNDYQPVSDVTYALLADPDYTGWLALEKIRIETTDSIEQKVEVWLTIDIPSSFVEVLFRKSDGSWDSVARQFDRAQEVFDDFYPMLLPAMVTRAGMNHQFELRRRLREQTSTGPAVKRKAASDVEETPTAVRQKLTNIDSVVAEFMRADFARMPLHTWTLLLGAGQNFALVISGDETAYFGFLFGLSQNSQSVIWRGPKPSRRYQVDSVVSIGTLSDEITAQVKRERERERKTDFALTSKSSDTEITSAIQAVLEEANGKSPEVTKWELSSLPGGETKQSKNPPPNFDNIKLIDRPSLRETLWDQLDSNAYMLYGLRIQDGPEKLIPGAFLLAKRQLPGATRVWRQHVYFSLDSQTNIIRVRCMADDETRIGNDRMYPVLKDFDEQKGEVIEGAKLWNRIGTAVNLWVEENLVQGSIRFGIVRLKLKNTPYKIDERTADNGGIPTVIVPKWPFDLRLRKYIIYRKNSGDSERAFLFAYGRETYWRMHAVFTATPQGIWVQLGILDTSYPVGENFPSFFHPTLKPWHENDGRNLRDHILEWMDTRIKNQVLPDGSSWGEVTDLEAIPSLVTSLGNMEIGDDEETRMVSHFTIPISTVARPNIAQNLLKLLAGTNSYAVYTIEGVMGVFIISETRHVNIRAGPNGAFVRRLARDTPSELNLQALKFREPDLIQRLTRNQLVGEYEEDRALSDSVRGTLAFRMPIIPYGKKNDDDIMRHTLNEAVFSWPKLFMRGATQYQWQWSTKVASSIGVIKAFIGGIPEFKQQNSPEVNLGEAVVYNTVDAPTRFILRARAQSKQIGAPVYFHAIFWTTPSHPAETSDLWVRLALDDTDSGALPGKLRTPTTDSWDHRPPSGPLATNIVKSVFQSQVAQAIADWTMERLKAYDCLPLNLVQVTPSGTPIARSASVITVEPKDSVVMDTSAAKDPFSFSMGQTNSIQRQIWELLSDKSYFIYSLKEKEGDDTSRYYAEDKRNPRAPKAHSLFIVAKDHNRMRHVFVAYYGSSNIDAYVTRCADDELTPEEEARLKSLETSKSFGARESTFETRRAGWKTLQSVGEYTPALELIQKLPQISFAFSSLREFGSDGILSQALEWVSKWLPGFKTLNTPGRVELSLNHSPIKQEPYMGNITLAVPTYVLDAPPQIKPGEYSVTSTQGLPERYDVNARVQRLVDGTIHAIFTVTGDEKQRIKKLFIHYEPDDYLCNTSDAWEFRAPYAYIAVESNFDIMDEVEKWLYNRTYSKTWTNVQTPKQFRFSTATAHGGGGGHGGGHFGGYGGWGYRPFVPIVPIVPIPLVEPYPIAEPYPVPTPYPVPFVDPQAEQRRRLQLQQHQQMTGPRLDESKDKDQPELFEGLRSTINRQKKKALYLRIQEILSKLTPEERKIAIDLIEDPDDRLFLMNLVEGLSKLKRSSRDRSYQTTGPLASGESGKRDREPETEEEEKEDTPAKRRRTDEIDEALLMKLQKIHDDMKAGPPPPPTAIVVPFRGNSVELVKAMIDIWTERDFPGEFYHPLITLRFNDDVGKFYVFAKWTDTGFVVLLSKSSRPPIGAEMTEEDRLLAPSFSLPTGSVKLKSHFETKDMYVEVGKTLIRFQKASVELKNTPETQLSMFSAIVGVTWDQLILDEVQLHDYDPELVPQAQLIRTWVRGSDYSTPVVDL